MRLDEPTLVPEKEWLGRHGGQVSVKVKMPVVDAPDSQLKGQVCRGVCKRVVGCDRSERCCTGALTT